MYAVIETGGKQYRVEVGTEFEVELLDVEPGESVTLERVLLVADGDETSIGQPLVSNAAVQAEVLRRERGDKVIVFKYRPKARTRVKKGHRQDHSILRVSDIVLNGKSAAEGSRKAREDAKTERQRLEEAAARQAAADAELAAKLARQSETKAPKAGRAGKAEASESRAKAAADATDTAKPKGSRAKAAAAESAAEPAEREVAAGESLPEQAATETTADTATADPATDETAVSAADESAADDTATEAGATDADETTADAPKRSRTKKDE